jgi:DNA modification methylase
MWPVAKINCSHAEVLPLHKIIPNPKNPNKHPPEQIERLAKLIDYQGQRHPIIVSRRSGFVVVGHGRLEAIKKLGWESAAVDFQDFADEAQEYAFVTSDNAIAEWAELDLAAINTEMLDLGPDFDIDLLGIKDFVIEPVEKFEPQSDEDDVPEVVHPITRKGDLWLLGKHRLLCGDSTMIDDVERLMGGEKADISFTSPPYNASKNDHLQKDVGGFDRKYKNTSDAMDDGDYLELLCQSTLNALSVSRYSFINLQLLAHNKFVLADYQHSMKEFLKDILIWNKKQCPPNIVKGAFNTKFEFVFCFSNENKTRGFPCDWRGKFANVVETESNSGNEFAADHKAGFPVAFPAWFFEKLDFAKSVFDPFCGTGTTIVCAEKFGLFGFGLELDESYCDVIVKRWEKYTGKQATLELTGQTYEELKAERDGTAA